MARARTTTRSPRPATSGRPRRPADRPARTWSPLDRPVDQVFELDTFTRHGAWASVTLRRWTAREQVAFRDLMGQEMIALGPGGDPKLMLGSMEAALIASLVQSWDGDWPDVIERDPTELEVRGRRRNPRTVGGEDEPVVESFDLTRREHLLALTDPYVYAELLQYAKEVQPDYMGTSGRALRAAPEEDDEEDLDDPGDYGQDLDDDEEGEERQDPPARAKPASTRSRTRSTPPVVKGEVLASDDQPRTRRTSASASRPRRSSTQPVSE